MNFLKIHTVATNHPDIYLVHWTNSTTRFKGTLKVRVTALIEDRHIAAELSAMRHLLEDKAVLGNNLVGNEGSHLICSLGAIRKLRNGESDKSHLAPYTNFLKTRFAGCPLTVEKRTDWFQDMVPESTDDLLVTGPRRETILVSGLGEVAVTEHVLERFADRYLQEQASNQTAHQAWKKLCETAAHKSVREVTRNCLWAGAIHNKNGKQEGRYFLNQHKNLVLVVTDNPREGKRLVTTYPATRHFHAMPKAA